MKYLRYLALTGLLVASPSFAQDTAPDGSDAFGIEPYVAVMGGYHDFDSDVDGPITINCTPSSGCPDGAVVEGIVGVNVPLGPIFVGIEGNLAKGFRGIKSEYGGYGRAGFRAGESGLIYGKLGYQKINTREKGKNDNWSYGGGVEVGPKMIGLGGITGASGVRLRLDFSTYDMKSIRPTAGVVFHF